MPPNNSKRKAPDKRPSDAFTVHVETVLKKFNDPAWLGRHSPLATSYFLNLQLSSYPDTPDNTQMGKALQQLIRTATNALEPEQALLIREAFFSLNTPTIVGHALQLGMKLRTYERRRSNAEKALSDQLIATTRPALHLEQPMIRITVARDKLISECLADLKNVQSVSLTGVSGTGKTTLGAEVANRWGITHVCWFTMRIGVNDQSTHLLFALAFFLSQRYNLHATWRQLISDKGKTPFQIALGLLRYDLESYASNAKTAVATVHALVCVDEIDLLSPDIAQHAEILQVLDAMRDKISLLVIGQRLVLATDHHYPVMGLSLDELILFSRHKQIDTLTPATQQRLHQVTGGNPALLLLFFALYQRNNELDAELRKQTIVPSIEFLFSRVWQRLKEQERSLLIQLCVFRGPAPRREWQKQNEALTTLAQMGLIMTNDHTANDNAGDVYVAPQLREVALRHIAPEDLLSFHLAAGQIMESYGKFTESAWHYIEAQHPANALWMWYIHRHQEIETGQAQTALQAFERIDFELLKPEDRKIYHSATAELLALVGKTPEAVKAAELATSTADGLLRVHAQTLLGDVLALQGQAERALQQYRYALNDMLDSPMLQQIALYAKSSRLHLTQLRDLQEAKREALAARARAELAYGLVEEQLNHLAEAKQHYIVSLELAEEIRQEHGRLVTLSQIHSSLGRLSLKQGLLEPAIDHIQHAKIYDRQRGDLVSPLYDQVNLVFALVQQGECHSDLNELEQDLAFARSIGLSEIVAGLSAGLSEVFLKSGNTQKAKGLATQALDTEDEHHRPWALTALAKVLRQEGNYAESIERLKEAIRLTQRSQNPYDEAYAHDALADVYVSRGDTPNHLASLQKAALLYSEAGALADAARIQQTINKQTTKP